MSNIILAIAWLALSIMYYVTGEVTNGIICMGVSQMWAATSQIVRP